MYCARELSSENLRAWVDLNQIIREWTSMDEKQRTTALNKIYTLYIQPDAELEINIQNVVKNSFLLLLGKGSFVLQRQENPSPETPSETTTQLSALMDLNKSVVENLADTFAR
jgi:hypothetical protein